VTAEGGSIGEVPKKVNVFVAVSLSLLYLNHLGGDSAHAEKGPLLTSQMFLFKFIHTNETKMDILVPLQEEHALGGEELND